MAKKSSRRKVIRFGIVAANCLVAVAAVVILFGQQSNADDVSLATLKSSSPSLSDLTPLDTVSSSEIAAAAAQLANLPESLAAANQADSDKIFASMSSFSGSDLTKPQVISSDYVSNKDIRIYVVRNSDTLSSVADKFNLKESSIQWSNNLSGTYLKVGQRLKIPPIDGIVYKVKSGDTVDSLAKKYDADKTKIITYNDAEIGGLKSGEQIIIAGGKVSPPVGSQYVSSFSWGGYNPIYANNRYDVGNCTWYAFNKRASMGLSTPSNLGNASSWLVGARAAGMSISHSPRKGAIIWYNPPSGTRFYMRDGGPYLQGVGYYGHVGIVDSVDGDGTIRSSSMNVHGLYSMGYSTMSSSQADEYWYIY